jgi:AraC-like DNA-binding protein
MSRATFGRAFPRLFGKTFVKYLAEVRIEQVCTLLAETERSVTEVAIGAGFGSLSNFNRQFLALKKYPPPLSKVRARAPRAERPGSTPLNRAGAQTPIGVLRSKARGSSRTFRRS